MSRDRDFIVEVRSVEEQKIIDQLIEGKAFGTLKGKDAMRDVVVNMAYSLSPEQYRRERKRQTDIQRKRFKTLAKRAKSNVLELLNSYVAGDISFTRLRKESKKAMKQLHEHAFTGGLRSSGTFSSQERSGIPEMGDEDLRYLRSVTTEEMKFFEKFLQDVRTGKARGRRMEQRLGMYIDATGSTFMSGRLLGTPQNHAMVWVDKHDSNECEGCKYLARNSPYHRDNIPTTPAAGTTNCLSNCRCVVMMRPVSRAVMQRMVIKGRKREYHLKKLREIKGRRL